MKSSGRVWSVGLLAIAMAVVMTWSAGRARAAGDDIHGVVTGEQGPEAGVWVIAETHDFDTAFRKIVVTDDAGRYLVPDLPAADYELWVRGYGLRDSMKVSAEPGDEVALDVVDATPEEAAEIYPASYWMSLLEVPAASDFPGTGPRGNGIGTAMKTQADWIDRMKDGCQLCHQIGNQATREMPMLDVSSFDSTADAWNYRIQAGGAGPAMSAEINRIGRPRAIRLYSEWSDRIAAGQLPPVPPRPEGIERNLVLSMWGWGHPQGMVHDNVSTDKRDPTRYGGGPIYGVGGAGLVVADLVGRQSVRMDLPTRVERQARGNSYQGASTAVPSLYYPNEPSGLVSRSAHNPMMDGKGRVWITQAVRPNDVPNWCLEGSDHPFAEYYPIQHRAESRQLSYYDPATEKIVLIDTCYFTHHLQFADDEDDTLWLSGSTEAVGWLNTRLYDATGDERTSQGWCPTVIDTNGDGVITKPWTEPTPDGEVEVDPARDTRIGSLDKFQRAYGIIPHPDGSVWITRRFPVPGQLIRLELGDNPPETCKSEVYEPPYDPTGDPSAWGYGPRGIDVDRNGLIWTALGGSGHFASFDRNECALVNGPTATGQHCIEGWTLYQTPGPSMQGVEGTANADYHYYSWVDQFDSLGLGANVPIATGTSSDALLALMPDSGEWVTMRVPYPLGFYSRGLDGRIDDPNTGWKGRGVWASFNTGSPYHLEGGKGTTSEIVQFQFRPHPLAE